VVYTKKDISNSLRNLGLARGDVVLVRAALRSLGALEGKAGLVLIEGLLDVVGEHGGILGLSYTKAYPFFRRNKNHVFRKDTPCITGGFAAAMLGWENAYRSRHPTNSMVAIGAKAEEILKEHNEDSTCCGPMQKLVDIDGKMILVGCIDSGPGFSTVHLVYENLNLANRSLVSGLFGSYYEKDGKILWFSKKDVPGCSMGFGKFYPYYRERGVLRSGDIGDAKSLLIGAKDAYEIEYERVKEDPRISLCDNPKCFSCRGTKLFDISGFPRYYISRILRYNG
jgi:aminoglycoside N3'-acetyltransferase